GQREPAASGVQCHAVTVQLQLDMGAVGQCAHDVEQLSGRDGDLAVGELLRLGDRDHLDFQVGTGKRDLTVCHLEQQVGQYRQRLAPFDHTHYLLQRLEQSFTLDAELHGGLPFTCCSFF